MGRTSRRRSEPHIKPIENVEISEKHVGRRGIAAAAFLLIGAGALAYAFVNLMRGDTGWTEIEAESSKLNCSGDFVLLYDVGSASARAEKKGVTDLYTAAAEKAYQMFSNEYDEAGTDESAADGGVAAGTDELSAVGADGAAGASDVGTGNVRFINDHPNQIVQVDGPLYEAFEKINASGRRELYLAAVYELYDNMFMCIDDSQLVDFDPRLNEDIAAYVKEILRFANDPEAVDLELLGENQVRLFVSDEYLDFARENEIDSFIDFYWMKNAFIADYLADTLTEAGYTHGSISSYDGFVRNLDERGTEYGYNILGRIPDGSGAGTIIGQLAVLQYNRPLRLVCLRDYMVQDEDRWRYYRLRSGEMRTSYIDVRDGLCRNSLESLVSYSYDETVGCADILLAVMPVYIADEFDAGALEALAGEKGGADISSEAPAGMDGSSEAPAAAVYSIYRRGNEIHANDPAAEFTAVYEGYTIVK